MVKKCEQDCVFYRQGQPGGVWPVCPPLLTQLQEQPTLHTALGWRRNCHTAADSQVVESTLH